MRIGIVIALAGALLACESESAGELPEPWTCDEQVAHACRFAADEAVCVEACFGVDGVCPFGVLPICECYPHNCDPGNPYGNGCTVYADTGEPTGGTCALDLD